MASYGQHAARIGPDRTCLIWLPASSSVPFFQRRPRPYCAKPIQIWSGGPGQVLGKCILCRNAGVQASSGPVSGRTQPACYHFPTFRLPFCQTARITLCKTSQDLSEFWMIISSFGQTDPIQKQASVQESSGLLLSPSESHLACLLGWHWLNVHKQSACHKQSIWALRGSTVKSRSWSSFLHKRFPLPVDTRHEFAFHTEYLQTLPQSTKL